MSAKLTTERCKACCYCIASCPKEAITQLDNVNSLGYKVVKVDEEKCVMCGICYTVCPEYVFEIE